MPFLLKKRPQIGTVSLPSYSVGEVSDRPAEIQRHRGTDPISVGLGEGAACVYRGGETDGSCL